MVAGMTRRSDILWGEGPEWEKPEETDAERAKRIQQQTILTNNQLDLLKGIIEGFRAVK
jgi:hypothetical protein